MQKELKYALTIILLAAAFQARAGAEVPLKMNFQGHLEESGSAVDGARNMIFKIYDSASGGTLLWTSETFSTQVSNGLFSVTLQTGTPTDLSTATFSGSGFVEVSVDGVTLLPRQEIISAPYSMVAKTLADNGCSANQVLKWNASSGWICSDMSVSSIPSGDYLNDVKVSSAIYADSAAGIGGNINPSQINAGLLPGTVYISSINAGSYLNDVKVSSAVYAENALDKTGGTLTGDLNITGGVTAASATFTAGGDSQYSLETSSGILVKAGTLFLTGANTYLTTQSSVTAPGFFGNGSGITGINAANIATGDLADARLSANVPLLNAANSFAYSDAVTAGITVSSGLVVANGNVNLAVSGGNVGIGKSNPAYKLDINGYVNAASGLCIADNCKTSWASVDNLGNHTAAQNIQMGTYYLSGDGGNEGLKVDASGHATFSGSVTGSSGTFTATGDAQYSLQTSSGILVTAGTLAVTGGRVGIGTAAPTGALHIAGSLAFKIATVTSDYTAGENDHILLCDANAGGIALTLPAAAGIQGRVYIIKKTDGSLNPVTIFPSVPDSIEGGGSFQLANQGESVTLVSTGATWLIIGLV